MLLTLRPNTYLMLLHTQTRKKARHPKPTFRSSTSRRQSHRSRPSPMLTRSSTCGLPRCWLRDTLGHAAHSEQIISLASAPGSSLPSPPGNDILCASLYCRETAWTLRCPSWISLPSVAPQVVQIPDVWDSWRFVSGRDGVVMKLG
jgi:hypothetical protein